MPIDTITIGAEESAWLPKGAKILAIDATDGLVLTSPSGCIDTVVEAKKCFKLSYTYTQDGSATGAWDAGDATNKVIGIYINGVLKTCSYAIVGDLTNIVNFMMSQSGGSITNTAFTLDDGDPSDKDTVNITFKAPSKIGNELYFKFQIAQVTGGPLTNVRVYAEEVTCEEPV